MTWGLPDMSGGGLKVVFSRIADFTRAAHSAFRAPVLPLLEVPAVLPDGLPPAAGLEISPASA